MRFRAAVGLIGGRPDAVIPVAEGASWDKVAEGMDHEKVEYALVYVVPRVASVNDYTTESYGYRFGENGVEPIGSAPPIKVTVDPKFHNQMQDDLFKKVVTASEQAEDSLAIGAGASGGAPQSSSEQAGAGDPVMTGSEAVGHTAVASPADLLLQAELAYASDLAKKHRLIAADREAVRRKAWVEALRWVLRECCRTSSVWVLKKKAKAEIARLEAGGEVLK